MQSAQLSRQFHSRGAAAIMLAVAALYVALTGGYAAEPLRAVGRGFGLPGAEALHLSPMWQTVASVAANLAVMALMVATNRAYNVLRSMSWLEVGLFALMQAAVPRGVTMLGSGVLMCLAVALCTFLILGCYDAPERTRTVFLTFLILSAGMAVEYAFAVYIIVFGLMLAQMRILSGRTAAAALMGIATVWILLLGSGAVSPGDLRLPAPAGPPAHIGAHSGLYPLCVAAAGALLLVMALGANVMMTIAYNARARAYNGALTVLALVTVVAMALDWGDMAAYLPLLNLCAAYQITHYFVNHRYDRQYIAVLAVAGIYVALAIWRLMLG